MNKIIVLKAQGKGDGKADFVSVHTFDDAQVALAFVALYTKPDEKYWTVASVIHSGEVLETDKESLGV